MAVPLTIKTTQQTSISTDLSAERLVNCFPRINGENAVAPLGLIGSHGYTEFGNAGAGSVVRGARATEDGTLGFVVTSNKLYTVSTSGTHTERGTLSTSTGNVSIAVGEDYAMIVDGTAGYSYNINTTTFATIADAQFLSNPTVCVHQDGYFITIGTSGGAYKLALSDLDDPTSWTTTNQTEAESTPDGLVSVISINRETFALGATTCEIYINTGKSGFPFSRQTSREFGCAAAFTPVDVDGACYWLGRTRRCKAMLLRAFGGNIEVVPNEDMNRLFQSLTTVSDAFAYAYTDAGQTFYEITFPTENQTWVYCINTNHFFKKQQNNGDRFVGSCYMFLNNKHIVGSRSNNKLFEMSLSVFTEDTGGSAIKRIITLPTIYDSYNWVGISNLIVNMDTSSFSTPRTLTLETSENGGDSFRTAQTWSVQQNVDYAQFDGISAAKRLTLKLTFDATNEFVLLNIMADVFSYGNVMESAQ